MAKEDRRALLIRITQEGRTEAGQAAKISRSVNGKIQKGFGADQVEALKEILGGILERFKSVGLKR